MRAILILIGLAAIVLIILMSFGMVSFDQTRSAQLPSIKVEGGQAPKFKADVGEIDVTTTNRTVEVPAIDIRRANETAPVQ